jgi:C4-dicarboxylate-specific signal transduction histidine kinase
METYEGFKAIDVKLHLPESIFCITDEHLILQVLINLLKNSFEALQGNTSETKQILIIHIEKQIDKTKLTIANNGPQIQNELREQIFIPFFTTKEQGSGVGLSLSKQIMVKLGGDIVLLPQKDKLTQFQLTIPS